jgi:DNA-binding MarR family transcriptional regulator
MTTPQRRRPSKADRTLEQLIKDLSALRELDPVERARAAKELIEVTKAVLSHERRHALLEANTTGPEPIGASELARRLGVARSRVTDAIALARSEVAGKA